MRAAAACLAAVHLMPLAAAAHHSLAAYDDGQVLELTGEVTEFEWVNPHIRIHVLAKDGTDAVMFEGGDIGRLTRLGWRDDAFQVGDTVTVSYNPFRDGDTGGHFLEITDAEGEIYSLIRFRRSADVAP